jgi:hypothetical protein
MALLSTVKKDLNTRAHWLTPDLARPEFSLSPVFRGCSKTGKGNVQLLACERIDQSTMATQATKFVSI